MRGRVARKDQNIIRTTKSWGRKKKKPMKRYYERQMSSNERKKLKRCRKNWLAEFVEIKKNPEIKIFALNAWKKEINSTLISKKERLDKRLSKLITSRLNQKIFVFLQNLILAVWFPLNTQHQKSQKRSLSSTLALILVNMYCPWNLRCIPIQTLQALVVLLTLKNKA